MTTTQIHSVKLEVNVRFRKNSDLSLTYKASNTSRREIYLFNLLFVKDPTGRRSIDHNKIYREVRGDILYLSKKLWLIPNPVLVEYPEIPYLTHLPPGESHSEEIAIDAPVRESYPYAHPKAEGTGHKRKCQGIVFSLGYFVARENRWVKKVKAGDRDALATNYGFAIQTNEVVSTKTIPLQCECIVLDDPRRKH